MMTPEDSARLAAKMEAFFEADATRHQPTDADKDRDLRNWFAGMAMQGILAGNLLAARDIEYLKNISEAAYAQADAMLAARGK